MDIPKAKVIIYVLTFIGYIWSGYGSGILTNLRDAVIAAEDVFGNFLVKFGDVVQKIKTVHDTIDSSLDEECLWNCPNGAVPVKNKYHRPTVNGCGPAGMEIKSEQLSQSEMTRCCNEHDLCYGTCNTNKERCDIAFRKCLYNTCDINTKVDEIANKACKATAKMLFTATTALGCKFFQDAQAEACYCPPTKRKKYPADEL